MQKEEGAVAGAVAEWNQEGMASGGEADEINDEKRLKMIIDRFKKNVDDAHIKEVSYEDFWSKGH